MGNYEVRRPTPIQDGQRLGPIGEASRNGRGRSAESAWRSNQRGPCCRRTLDRLRLGIPEAVSGGLLPTALLALHEQRHLAARGPTQGRKAEDSQDSLHIARESTSRIK